MVDLIPFGERVRKILKEKKISHTKFEMDTGIGRRILYEVGRKHYKSMLMAIAYYLNMTVEDLVEGTDAEYDWCG